MCGSDGKEVDLYPQLLEASVLAICQKCQLNRHVPPEEFVKTIARSVDDETVSNKQFRKLVREGLSKVVFQHPDVKMRTVVTFEPPQEEPEEEMEIFERWHCPTCKYDTRQFSETCPTCHGVMVAGELPIISKEEEAEFENVKVDVMEKTEDKTVKQG